MALTDRVRDILGMTNAIDVVLVPRKPDLTHKAATAYPFPGGAASPAPAQNGHARGAAPAVPDPAVLLGALHVVQKRREWRYFEDAKRKHLVLRATAKTIISRREDRAAVGAMLDLAQGRGWYTMTVRGTANFKREVETQAQVRGLEIRSVAPVDVGRQVADPRPAERAATQTVSGQTAVRQDSVPGTAGAVRQEPHAAPPRAPAPPTRTAQEALSLDGRLVLAALMETIDRQMHRLHAEAKADIKAFAAAALVDKERAEGPTVLSAEQKRVAVAPNPPQATMTTALAPGRHREPQTPHRSLGR